MSVLLLSLNACPSSSEPKLLLLDGLSRGASHQQTVQARLQSGNVRKGGNA